MKKLTAKQRQRRPKPRRRLPPRGLTGRQSDPLEIDGWVVRLPDEESPYVTGPQRPMIPVYVGWKGRAMHIQMAVLFETRDEAEAAAAAFPDATVRPLDIWHERGGCKPVSWISTALPDPAVREATFPAHIDSNNTTALLAERTREAKLEAAMTIPDERAPQRAVLQDRVIEQIHLNTPMEFKFKM